MLSQQQSGLGRRVGVGVGGAIAAKSWARKEGGGAIAAKSWARKEGGGGGWVLSQRKAGLGRGVGGAIAAKGWARKEGGGGLGRRVGVGVL